MAETNLARRPALATLAPSGAPETATVLVLPPATRFALRIDPAEAAAIGTAAEFDLTGPINSVRGGGDRLAVRTGPDEWLLIAADGEGLALEAALSAAFGAVFHSLVDISHRNVALQLSGPAVADVLNAGCALDLSDGAFPPGSATRTLLGKSEIVLIRPADDKGWRVECWRSFSPYVQAYLNEAAR
ncbi:sarcosine oxidase subunit gamma family protein [Pseudoxanthobacter sp.]|uniref:sarcosine oxidase subunit gamma n=1 Tax=Pseudoxanthobacter sp. TaxID=1925742 RepID=UPI002FE21AF8